jgi:predicted nucleic acid-binding protein
VARLSVVLDTTVVIDILRATPAAISYASALAAPPTCSEITRVEILRGVRSAERFTTERVLAGFRWVALDESIARRAGEMGREWRRSHPGIETPDLIVAATADELGLKLATTNVKHFPMFRGLRAPYRG